MRGEKIGLGIFRHLQPVEAAHIFAPAEDLADEAFDGIERCISPAPLLRAVADFAGVRRPMLR